MTPPDARLRRQLRLVVLTDTSLAAPRSVLDVVTVALQAGVRAIQLRDKQATAAALFEQALPLLRLTRSHQALLLVNDRIDVALAAGADGVHLGPTDVPVAAARRIAPEGFLIGFSTDDPVAARKAEEAGADYIGCGTVFPTTTKPEAGSVIGPRGLERVADAVRIPVIGIGGITAAGSRAIAKATHATGVAVVGAVMGAEDPVEAVRALLLPWEARDG